MIDHTTVEQGIIVSMHKKTFSKELPWNAHPTFKGVYLKHLVKGEDTDGNFSCHLVKVEAGCEIGLHIHEGKWELHEVLEGNGECTLDQQIIPYHPGVTAIIPENTKHIIKADQELYLLAKFIPALI
jgi:quercetin dioxygenase-like cupin family protein